jgi:hypothetical protein
MENKEIEEMAIEFSKTYLFEHKQTAVESFTAGLSKAKYVIEQMETALEVCNQERKKHRNEADFANAAYAKLQKEYESLLGASSLLI